MISYQPDDYKYMTYPIPFQVFDAAIQRAVLGLAPSFAEVGREKLGERVRYTFSTNELGLLGELTLQSLSDGEGTQVDVTRCASVARDLSPQELAEIQSVTDANERVERLSRLNKKILDERHELDLRRGAQFEKVFDALFRLVNDALVMHDQAHAGVLSQYVERRRNAAGVAAPPPMSMRVAPAHQDGESKTQVQRGFPPMIKQVATSDCRDLPKGDKTRQKWSQAWQVIRGLRKKYEQDYSQANTDNPQPRLEDCRDALAQSKLKWKPSTKTLSKIIAAGDAGCLKPESKRRKRR